MVSKRKKEKDGFISIGLGSMIFLVFLTLKLGEFGQVANWSWWWVTSPLWIVPAILIGIFAIVALFILILKMFRR